MDFLSARSFLYAQKSLVLKKFSWMLLSKLGFTLVELIVVMAVIAVLALLAIFGLSAAQKGARDSQRVSILNNMRTAMQRYNTDNGIYPLGNFSAVYSQLTFNEYLPTTVNDPGCGGGPVNLGSSYMNNGKIATPCGSGGPRYSINANASGFTLVVYTTESNGGTVTVLGTQ